MGIAALNGNASQYPKTRRSMINNFHYFKEHIFFKYPRVLGGILILATLAACSKPTVPVFEANKFRTTTGNIEKNDKKIKEINTQCEEDREEIRGTVEKMRSLLAGSR